MQLLRVLLHWLHAGCSLKNQHNPFACLFLCIEFTLSHLTRRVLQVSQLSMGLLRVILFLAVDTLDAVDCFLLAGRMAE